MRVALQNKLQLIGIRDRPPSMSLRMGYGVFGLEVERDHAEVGLHVDGSPVVDLTAVVPCTGKSC